ncbi:MAG: pilus assembly FimT family protein, partial [Minisyncoccia bacterium]
KKKHQQKNKGFTMVEFVVVLSIFAIMSGVSTFDYNSYRTTIERTNLAQDIALTIRQAQVYGISASEGTIGSENFDAETELDNSGSSISDIVRDTSIRGVSFDIQNNDITLFADAQYSSHPYYFVDNVSNPDRVIDQRNPRYRDVGFEYACLCDAASCEREIDGTVDIAFERPYPDAVIYHRNSAGANARRYSDVSLVVSSSSNTDNNEYIKINSIGNITVQSNYDPSTC